MHRGKSTGTEAMCLRAHIHTALNWWCPLYRAISAMAWFHVKVGNVFFTFRREVYHLKTVQWSKSRLQPHMHVNWESISKLRNLPRWSALNSSHYPSTHGGATFLLIQRTIWKPTYPNLLTEQVVHVYIAEAILKPGKQMRYPTTDR